MIDKKAVSQIVEEWLKEKDYFLVEVKVSADNKIVVEIDHAEGVWIEDCVELSRFIESKLDRDEEDFELEVGSAGVGQPFKVMQQYYNHIGRQVEVKLKTGDRLEGELIAVEDDAIKLAIEKKIKEEGEKRPKLRTIEEVVPFEEIKYTKYLISFK